MSDDSLASGGKPPFSRIVAPDDAGSARGGHIEASPAERERLAGFYGVENIAAFTFDYDLDPLPSQRYRVTGEVKAELTQLCVVTMETVTEHINEAVSLEYWPEHLLKTADRDPAAAEDVLADDPPEPLVNGRIDLGALAAEILATAIDPYPRKPDAAFDWEDPKAAAEKAASNPFAALARLKSKP